MVFILLQWNEISVIGNGQEFIDEFENKPHLICVQESWLKPHLSFVVQGYTALGK